ncbi:hypothetical protein GUITHDRAFT_111483 [Guillardia theta CCMP2712]|uniref:Uncharacterized protein n=2 Tax=Guillardia theta TaxID=55529 RepID=L1J1V0_GUITC|nr:hypothetical protein GUITHDRAFT_111483 [Guillardia theta CCMP2712]EKX42508.1 hypothetical protein GUITHDRAFT_111483 [Guillardia theta CCMP2712]|eukprot:XP_005829488.1 hypothetical protein GUITHDRAFT_111483 [Guillardia theta CCMP2712]
MGAGSSRRNNGGGKEKKAGREGEQKDSSDANKDAQGGSGKEEQEGREQEGFKSAEKLAVSGLAKSESAVRPNEDAEPSHHQVAHPAGIEHVKRESVHEQHSEISNEPAPRTSTEKRRSSRESGRHQSMFGFSWMSLSRHSSLSSAQGADEGAGGSDPHAVDDGGEMGVDRAGAPESFRDMHGRGTAPMATDGRREARAKSRLSSTTDSMQVKSSQETHGHVEEEAMWEEEAEPLSNECCFTINLSQGWEEMLAEQTAGTWRSRLSRCMELDEGVFDSITLDRLAVRVTMVAPEPYSLFHRALLMLINRMLRNDLPETDLLRAALSFSVQRLPPINSFDPVPSHRSAGRRKRKFWVYISLNVENEKNLLGNEFVDKHLIPALSCRLPLVDLVVCNPRDHYGCIPKEEDCVEDPFCLLFQDKISVQEAELRCALATWTSRARFLALYCCKHRYSPHVSHSGSASPHAALLEQEMRRYKSFLHAQRSLCLCNLSEDEKTSLVLRSIVDELQEIIEQSSNDPDPSLTSPQQPPHPQTPSQRSSNVIPCEPRVDFPLNIQEAAHRNFADSMCRQGPPNRPVLQQLLNAVRKGEERILVTGPAGSGKTTILSRFSRKISQVLKDSTVIEHYDEAYGMQDRYVSMLRRFCGSLGRLLGEQVEETQDALLGNQLNWLLRKVSGGCKEARQNSPALVIAIGVRGGVGRSGTDVRLSLSNPALLEVKIKGVESTEQAMEIVERSLRTKSLHHAGVLEEFCEAVWQARMPCQPGWIAHCCQLVRFVAILLRVKNLSLTAAALQPERRRTWDETLQGSLQLLSSALRAQGQPLHLPVSRLLREETRLDLDLFQAFLALCLQTSCGRGTAQVDGLRVSNDSTLSFLQSWWMAENFSLRMIDWDSLPLSHLAWRSDILFALNWLPRKMLEDRQVEDCAELLMDWNILVAHILGGLSVVYISELEECIEAFDSEGGDSSEASQHLDRSLLLLTKCKLIRNIYHKIRNVKATQEVFLLTQVYHELQSLQALQPLGSSLGKRSSDKVEKEGDGEEQESEREQQQGDGRQQYPRSAFVSAEASRIEVTDRADGKEGGSTGMENFAFTHVTFAPNGSSLISISGYDGRVRLFDLARREKMDEIAGHASTVNMSSFDSAGSLLACAADDGSLSVWQLGSRGGDKARMVARCRSREQGDRDGHEDSVGRCLFHPDGKLIISSSDDLSIKIWTFSSSTTSSFAKVVFSLAPQAGCITLLCCSLLRPVLLSGDEEGVLDLWDISVLYQSNGSLQVKGTNVWKRREREEAALCGSFSPDGECFLVGHADGYLLLVSSSSFDVLSLLLLDVVPQSLSFSSQSSASTAPFLWLVSDSACVLAVDLKEEEEIARFQLESTAGGSSMALLPGPEMTCMCARGDGELFKLKLIDSGRRGQGRRLHTRGEEEEEEEDEDEDEEEEEKEKELRDRESGNSVVRIAGENVVGGCKLLHLHSGPEFIRLERIGQCGRSASVKFFLSAPDIESREHVNLSGSVEWKEGEGEDKLLWFAVDDPTSCQEATVFTQDEGGGGEEETAGREDGGEGGGELKCITAKIVKRGARQRVQGRTIPLQMYSEEEEERWGYVEKRVVLLDLSVVEQQLQAVSPCLPDVLEGLRRFTSAHVAKAADHNALAVLFLSHRRPQDLFPPHEQLPDLLLLVAEGGGAINMRAATTVLIEPEDANYYFFLQTGYLPPSLVLLLPGETMQLELVAAEGGCELDEGARTMKLKLVEDERWIEEYEHEHEHEHEHEAKTARRIQKEDVSLAAAFVHTTHELEAINGWRTRMEEEMSRAERRGEERRKLQEKIDRVLWLRKMERMVEVKARILKSMQTRRMRREEKREEAGAGGAGETGAGAGGVGAGVEEQELQQQDASVVMSSTAIKEAARTSGKEEEAKGAGENGAIIPATHPASEGALGKDVGVDRGGEEDEGAEEGEARLWKGAMPEGQEEEDGEDKLFEANDVSISFKRVPSTSKQLADRIEAELMNRFPWRRTRKDLEPGFSRQPRPPLAQDFSLVLKGWAKAQAGAEEKRRKVPAMDFQGVESWWKEAAREEELEESSIKISGRDQSEEREALVPAGR